MQADLRETATIQAGPSSALLISRDWPSAPRTRHLVSVFELVYQCLMIVMNVEVHELQVPLSHR